jgi:hypothetical protein
VAEVSVFSPKHSFRASAAVCGSQERDVLETECPPMLAAQSSFPSGPLAKFSLNFCSTNLEMKQHKKEAKKKALLCLFCLC